MEPDNMIREIIKYPNGTYLKIEIHKKKSLRKSKN